jgi:hypothetical protein
VTTHGDAVGSSASAAASAPMDNSDDVGSDAAGSSSPKTDRRRRTATKVPRDSDTSAQPSSAEVASPPVPSGDSAPVPSEGEPTAEPVTDPDTAPATDPDGAAESENAHASTDTAPPGDDSASTGGQSAPSTGDTAPAGEEAAATDADDAQTAPDTAAEAATDDAASAGADAPTSGADAASAAEDTAPPGDEGPATDSEDPDPPAAEEASGAAPAEAAASQDVAVLETTPPVEPPEAVGELATALSRLRAAIGAASYPLVMPSAEEGRRVGAALVAQLDDYLLPRLARLDAPLLVVVGGSTGAGKSTLVNSLVRAPVSAAGVLRPTTRSPVLVSNAADLPWFRQGELLPGLTRTTESTSDANTLQLVAAPALGPGLAFLDAPDIDSVVDRNRALAAQLLAAADLWLFVTTAARYADAVPWELLTTARLRGTVIALVLDRVPAEAAGEISAHLGEMLAEHDMSAAPLFVLPETTLDGQGLLPEQTMRPLHDWFGQLAADATARAAVVRQTLDGALAALGPAVDGLADAAEEQMRAAQALDERVTMAYRNAKRTVEEGLRDGRMLRGEVLARWQEFVGTGEFLRSLESKVGQLRDRVVSALTGRPAPGRNLQIALESQLVTLLRGVASDAAEQAYQAWQAHPAGAALLAPALQQPAPDLPQRADRLVRDWQQWVLDLVRSEAGDKRIVARGVAYAVNGVGLAVMIAVFTSTAFIPTGLEVAVGAGTTVAAQKVLEAVFGDQAIRTLATRAREELLARIDALLDGEAARFTDRTAAVGLELEPSATLRTAADEVEAARAQLALTSAGSVPLPRGSASDGT